jgi:hypothetical protein
MARLEDHKVPIHSCPNCNKEMDGAMDVTNAQSRPPENGDVAICFYCSHIAIYEDGQLRNPNDEEMKDIAGDIDVVHAINAIAHGRSAKKG